jgi:hypothetical protein
VEGSSPALRAALTRKRNLPLLALAMLGLVFHVPLLLVVGSLLYCAAVAADRHRDHARLPSLSTLGDFEVRLAVRSLVEARDAAALAVARLPRSLVERRSLPARLAELEAQARPLVEQADRLGCFLFYRVRRGELERDALQLSGAAGFNPVAQRSYRAAADVVRHQLRVLDELHAERERLLASLAELTAHLRALPSELERLHLYRARLAQR